uniref:Uncharacterized protein n=1 Tax=Tanacetum cinerariifolium TaxID=118510 RepID=A0A699GG51_TANCI|nr:hypothetical protein [Tanacetum cinerariifolium]
MPAVQQPDLRAGRLRQPAAGLCPHQRHAAVAAVRDRAGGRRAARLPGLARHHAGRVRCQPGHVLRPRRDARRGHGACRAGHLGRQRARSAGRRLDAAPVHRPVPAAGTAAERVQVRAGGAVDVHGQRRHRRHRAAGGRAGARRCLRRRAADLVGRRHGRRAAGGAGHRDLVPASASRMALARRAGNRAVAGRGGRHDRGDLLPQLCRRRPAGLAAVPVRARRGVGRLPLRAARRQRHLPDRCRRRAGGHHQRPGAVRVRHAQRRPDRARHLRGAVQPDRHGAVRGRGRAQAPAGQRAAAQRRAMGHAAAGRGAHGAGVAAGGGRHRTARARTLRGRQPRHRRAHRAPHVAVRIGPARRPGAVPGGAGTEPRAVARVCRRHGFAAQSAGRDGTGLRGAGAHRRAFRVRGAGARRRLRRLPHLDPRYGAGHRHARAGDVPGTVRGPQRDCLRLRHDVRGGAPRGAGERCPHRPSRAHRPRGAGAGCAWRRPARLPAVLPRLPPAGAPGTGRHAGPAPGGAAGFCLQPDPRGRPDGRPAGHRRAQRAAGNLRRRDGGPGAPAVRQHARPYRRRPPAVSASLPAGAAAGPDAAPLDAAVHVAARLRARHRPPEVAHRAAGGRDHQPAVLWRGAGAHGAPRVRHRPGAADDGRTARVAGVADRGARPGRGGQPRQERIHVAGAGAAPVRGHDPLVRQFAAGHPQRRARFFQDRSGPHGPRTRHVPSGVRAGGGGHHHDRQLGRKRPGTGAGRGARRAVRAGGRRPPAAADPGQPGGQRHQVHRARIGVGAGGTARRIPPPRQPGAAALYGGRHRHRHCRRPPGAAVRAICPGGRFDDAPLRRHRPGADHLAPHCRADAGHDRRAQHARRRQRIRADRAAAAGRRRLRRHAGHRVRGRCGTGAGAAGGRRPRHHGRLPRPHHPRLRLAQRLRPHGRTGAGHAGRRRALRRGTARLPPARPARPAHLAGDPRAAGRRHGAGDPDGQRLRPGAAAAGRARRRRQRRAAQTGDRGAPARGGAGGGGGSGGGSAGLGLGIVLGSWQPACHGRRGRHGWPGPSRTSRPSRSCRPFRPFRRYRRSRRARRARDARYSRYPQ